MAKWRFLELNADEIKELDRQSPGEGGFERLIRRLQKQLNHATSTLKITDDDLEKIQNCALDYKTGGFESRLQAIFGRLLGPKLGREE
jgi:hypothetical protein